MTKVRLISMAWGRSYVDSYLEHTLRSILAPGNLPSLAEHFDCEAVFVTLVEDFDYVRSHEAVIELQRICPFRLVEIDDLISPWYGVTLTHAFMRGHEDIAPDDLKKTYLLFLNADFILADGCYKNLIPHMQAGERMLFSPSYCVEADKVEPILADHRKDNPALAMSHRQMANVALTHRHNTIRCKTVNGEKRLKYIDQFYFEVDDTCLLARQMPIAIVALKPEVALDEPTTFWDYGIFYDYCPDSQPVILGDSDEFVMIELRDHDISKDQISDGWPSQQVIADQLSTFISDYMVDFGKYPLVLHYNDIPSDANAHMQSFDTYVADVLNRVRSHSYNDHFMWHAVSDLFNNYRALAKFLGIPLLRTKTVLHWTQVSVLTSSHTKISILHKLLQTTIGSSVDPRLLYPYLNEIKATYENLKPHLGPDQRRIIITRARSIFGDTLMNIPGENIRVDLDFFIDKAHPDTSENTTTSQNDFKTDLLFIDCTDSDLEQLISIFDIVSHPILNNAKIVIHATCYGEVPKSALAEIIRNYEAIGCQIEASATTDLPITNKREEGFSFPGQLVRTLTGIALGVVKWLRKGLKQRVKFFSTPSITITCSRNDSGLN